MHAFISLLLLYYYSMNIRIIKVIYLIKSQSITVDSTPSRNQWMCTPPRIL